MTGESGAWEFRDDRGRTAAGSGRPRRVVAYVQAGLTLWQLGVKPVAVFGSAHDGAEPDPVKAGGLTAEGVGYLGPGTAVGAERILEQRPDLLVTVVYDGRRPYALAGEVAERLEEEVPLAALSVSGRGLPAMRAAFAGLARSLGAEPERADPAASREEAEARLRAAAAAAPGLRVLALSGVDADKGYAARPESWPDLGELAGCGVRFLEPPRGSGVNWTETLWPDAAALRPDIVLLDARGNATGADVLRASGEWRQLERGAVVVPWNPEPALTHRAAASFAGAVADAYAARGARQG